MKKVLSLVLVLSMVLGSFSFAFAAPNDVVGTEYEDAVERLGQLKVLEGYPDGTFKPGNEITRAEFAAVVIRAKGLAAAADAAKGATGFTDVPATNWAAGYINIASKMGFVKGMGDGTFAPNSPVTYEQAVTMVMRALGYEPAAEARGGYPYGYLIVANETGLLESVKGTQGLPAPRGLVAQIVDNALEIPLMVQVSYGDRVEHIVSGTRDGVAEKTLLSELGFVKVAGRVTEINEDKSLIRIGDKSLKVGEGFDFQEAYGLRLRVWYDDLDKVVLYTKLDTPLFDAVEYDNNDLYLYGEDKNYDLATDKDGKEIATLLLDGKKVNAKDFNADYAKVVLDSYGDIIWAQGFTFNDNIVVEKLDGNLVESYKYDELSLKGYTIVKDGKALSVEDLEENDIVFYNSANKFAVVYNEGIEGKIEQVYTTTFKFDGSIYSISGAKFLDDKVLGGLSEDALNRMEDNEEEVTLFVDFYGNAVLVLGTRVPASTSSNYFLVVEDSTGYPGRGLQYFWTLDVMNAEGKVVAYDVSQDFVDDYNDGKSGSDLWANAVKAGKVVSLTLNTSDKVTKVEVLNPVTSAANDFKVTSSYVEGLKLQPSTLVFRQDTAAATTDYEDYSVTTLGEAEEDFTEIESGAQLYVNASDRVVVIVGATNAVDTVDYIGLVKSARVLTGGKKADVTIEIEGKDEFFTTKATSGTIDLPILAKGNMVKVTVVDKTREITGASPADARTITVDKVTLSPNRITSTELSNNQYDLTEAAVVYAKSASGTYSKIRISDIKADDVVEVYYRFTTASRYIAYVVKLPVLTDAQKAAAVDTQIEALNNSSAEAVVRAAKTAYDNLTADQRALVKAANVTKLNGLLAKFDGAVTTVAATVYDINRYTVTFQVGTEFVELDITEDTVFEDNSGDLHQGLTTVRNKLYGNVNTLTIDYFTKTLKLDWIKE